MHLGAPLIVVAGELVSEARLVDILDKGKGAVIVLDGCLA